MPTPEDVSFNNYVEGNIVDKMLTLATYKGYFSKDTLYYAFDAIDNCIGERCRVYDECKYEKPKVDKKTGEMTQKKCQHQRIFLKGVSLMIFRNYYETITEMELFHVGMQLMPLYKTLCKLHLREMNINDPIYTDDKGIIRPNPIYKEIRDTIGQIQKTWRSLGLEEAPDEPSQEELFKNGNPDYYDNLEKSTRQKEKQGNGRQKILKRKRTNS